MRAAGYEFLDDEAEPHFDLSFSVQSSSARGGLTVAFDWKDNLNFYALEITPGDAALRAVIEGRPQRLATAKANFATGTKVTIKRRPWTMQVLVGDRVLLTAFDAAFTTGKIGALSSGGWSWKDARVQPVDEEIFFNDDFTRVAGQGNEWVESGGKWTLTASSDSISQKNVEMSANPFSYLVSTPASAAFTTIEPRKSRFWDNYDAQVSVRPGGRGAVGLAVYVQDAKNYLAFQWSAAEGPSARQLVRVEDGKATVLARAPGAFLPRQWYRLGVRTSPGFVECFVDSVPVFKIADASFGQGGIGLIAQYMAAANFDDVRIRSYEYYRLDFTGAVSGAWTPLLGVWTPQNGVLTSAPSKEDKGATRLDLMGRADWTNYHFSIQARSGTAGACGIVVGYRDNANYTVFRWAGPKSAVGYAGKQQILVYRAGKAQIVRDEPAALLDLADKDGYVPISLHVAPGALAIYAGNRLLAQRADDAVTPGRPGLYAQGLTSPSFREAVMYFPPSPEPAKVAPKMADDALMVGWASPAGEWPVGNGGGNVREFWNTGEFFGDAALEYVWKRGTVAGNQIEFALRAASGKFDSGYVLRFEGLGKKDGLRATLLRGAATLKQGDIKAQDAVEEAKEGEEAAGGVPLKVTLEGRGVLLSVNNHPAMSYVAPDDVAAPPGTRFAVRSTNTVVRTNTLRAFSANRDDYTFTEAPTDWYSTQGHWAVISRWPCYSDWSFFGGEGLNPVLWSKRIYGGDTVVEIYANNQMDLPKEIGYSNPGNLNITVLGDGKNLASGYSFVVAGWNNTRSRLMKGTQVVAESVAPNARFERPINQNLSFHKKWFYIRAEARLGTRGGKTGLLLRLTLDDEPLLEYFDATPLPSAQSGGHVAFWTVDGAMMIARAKIESAVPGARIMPEGLLDAAISAPTGSTQAPGALTPRPMLSDGLPSTVLDEANDIWTARNPTTGGLFAVNLAKADAPKEKPASLTITPQSKIEWEWQPGEAKLDLYATLGDEMLMLALTDAQPRDARVKSLGDIRKEPGFVQNLPGGWQRVTFPLGAALQKLHPDQTSWNLDALTLGALHGDDYRWLGFAGNPHGASYKLRNARLTG